MSGALRQTTRRSLSTFSHSKRGNFFQEKPKLTNQYDEDPFMREQLQIEIPKEHLKEIEGDLRQFGHKLATNIWDLHLECERNPPKLEPFDGWGKRIDRLITCDAWKQQKRISAEEGLIAIPYENKFSIYSRLYQIYKLYMYTPSGGLYGCPLAMTDGAAKTIQTVGIQEFTREAFANLTSRDPNKFWTSGQWMTERKGGSDVSDGTETEAILQSGDHYKLYGYKWFSSATDSDMTILLARTLDENKKPMEKLTMFFARVRDNDGNLNGIEIQALKNKLGTRQLPTGELLLDGMDAYRMSEVGKGVAKMSSMLNITRLHNSLTAVGFMRRMINLCRDYATKRVAFGKVIIDHDLHCQTLGNMEVECRASFLTTSFVAKLLGKSECNQATEEEKELMRFLTPLLKLYTGKQAVAVTSEGLEAIGGQGYIEDTGLPTYFRDAQVLAIWEGTTNILSLDSLRSIQKSNGESIKIFARHVSSICEEAKKWPQLKDSANNVGESLARLLKAVKLDNALVTGAREFAYSLYRIFTASLIIERCMKTNLKETDLYLLDKWLLQDLTPFLTNQKRNLYDQKSIAINKKLFMSGHPSFKA